MIAVIIPIHNQTDNIQKIITGLERQTVIPDVVYFVFDRCQVESYTSNINIKNIHITEVPTSNRTTDNTGFYAGYARNKGIESAIEDGNDKFIFIDGDCVPQTNLVESHINALSVSMPVISIGRRREKEYRWLDKRETIPDLVNIGFFGKNGLVINNSDLLKNALVTWSCNLGINLLGLKLLQKFNVMYYGRNECFNSEFNGGWGGEDTFLGLCAWYCKIIITTVGHKSSGIEHISHTRPEHKYSISSKDYVDVVLSNLKKKLVINPITIEFFT